MNPVTLSLQLLLAVDILISASIGQTIDNASIHPQPSYSVATSGGELSQLVKSGVHRDSGKRFKRQAEKYLRALDVKATYFWGEPVPKSAYIECNLEKSCDLTVKYEHSEQVRHATSLGVEMSPVTLLKLVAHVSIEKLVGNAVSTSYGIHLGPHTKARVMFRPRLVRLKGNVTMDRKCIKQVERVFSAIVTVGVSEIFNKDAPDCDDHKLGPFEIIAPACSTQRGNKNDILDGEWFIEYKDNPLPIDTQFFHNIRDKTIPDLKDVHKHPTSVGNPMMCSSLAKDYSYKVAIYHNTTCYMMTKNNEDVKSYTSDGKYIGDYGIDLSEDKKTKELAEMHEWVEGKTCDLVEYDGTTFHCKKFKKKTNAVIMFKKSSTSSPNLLDLTDVGDPIS